MATQPGPLGIHAAARIERLVASDILRRRRAEILADTAAALLSGVDPESEVLPNLYRALKDECIADAILAFSGASSAGPLTLRFVDGFPPEMVERCRTLEFGRAICGTVALARKALHVTDIQRSFEPTLDHLRSAGISAYACEPLIAGDRLLGTLSFARRVRRSFDADDLVFFNAVAKQVAIARSRKSRAA